ncbi:MAG: VCBS repeat-containing protein [Planctomycetota bacterium]
MSHRPTLPDLARDTLLAFSLLGSTASAQIQEPFHFEGSARWYRNEASSHPDDERPEIMGSVPIDFDRDGDLDLVTANGYYQIDLLENRLGTFIPISTTVPPRPYVPKHLETGDFDGDGLSDLLVTGFTSTNPAVGFLQVQLGNGSGGFIPLPPMTAKPYSFQVAVADLDRDGRDEIAVADGWSGTVEIFSATQKTDEIDLGLTAARIEAADLDGDGAPDLVALAAGGQQPIAIRLNDGQGGFPLSGARTAGGGWNQAIDLGTFDVDADGDQDLVTTEAYGGPFVPTDLIVLLNDGTAGFAPEVRSVILNLPWASWDMEQADVDEDGRLDLVLAFDISRAGGPSSIVTTLRNLGGGSFATIDSVSTRTRNIALLDIDGDQRLEVVGENIIMPIRRDGTLGGSPLDVATVGVHSQSVVVDLDRNGTDDLILSEQLFGQVEIHMTDGEGNATRTAIHSLSDPINSMRGGDFDGDGWPDLALILVLPDGSAQLAVMFNNGSGGLLPPVRSPFSFPQCPSCYIADWTPGDVNGDGWTDLIFSAYRSSEGAFAISQGNGQFVISAFTFPASTGEILYEDLTGDGISDMLIASVATLYVIPGQGGGQFGAPRPRAFPDRFAEHKAAADTDGDGDLDLVASTSNGLFHLENDGTGRFSLKQHFNEIALGTREISLTDLDGDGDIDLAARNEDRQVAVYFYRNESGSFIFTNPALEVGTNASPESFLVDYGDFDADGFQDVLVVAEVPVDDSVPVAEIFFNRSNLRGNGRAAPGDRYFFELHAGDAALQPFQMLASRRGTFPGVTLPSVSLPLNSDSLLWPLIQGGGLGVFVGFQGTFDARGRARAEMRVPAVLPVALPFDLDFAYFSGSNRPGASVRTSNALSVTVR